MKTNDIIRALRASATPAARLAAWQARPTAYRLRQLRDAMARPYSSPATLAEARRNAIAAQGPELSSPEAEKPFLWTSESSPQVMEAIPGREFLDHRGWFSNQYQGETLETYAVTLAAFPRLVFYAVKESCNGDLRVNLEDWEEIDFSDCESEYDATEARREAAKGLVRSCDSGTQREAENAVEYSERYEKEQTLSDNRETLAALRPEIRALAHELAQPGNRANPDAPLVRAACKNLRALLADRQALTIENANLRNALA